MFLLPSHVRIVPMVKCLKRDRYAWTVHVDVKYTCNMCPVQGGAYVDIIFWVTSTPSRSGVDAFLALRAIVLSPSSRPAII